MSTATIKTVRDREPRTATLTFTQLLSSVTGCVRSCCLKTEVGQEKELVADVILWCVCVCVQGCSCGFQVHC